MALLLQPSRWAAQPQTKVGLSGFNPASYWIPRPEYPVFDLQGANNLSFAGAQTTERWANGLYGFSYISNTVGYWYVNLAQSISAFPFVIGCSFEQQAAEIFTGGAKTVIALGEDTVSSGGAYCSIEVNQASINELRGVCRAVTSGTAGVAAAATAIPSQTLLNVAWVCRSQTSRTLWINGISLVDTTDVGGTPSANPFKWFGLAATVRQNTPVNLGDMLTHQCWYDTVDLGDSFYQDWTCDPWKYLTVPPPRIWSLPIAAAGVRVPYTPWPQLGPMVAQ